MKGLEPLCYLNNFSALKQIDIQIAAVFFVLIDIECWPQIFNKNRIMIHDKIQMALKEVQKIEEKFKDIKKDMREEEKLDEESYLELKSALKDLRTQVKDREDEHLQALQSDNMYNELRTMKMQAEEELAQAKEKLFKLLAEVPLKPFEMDMSDGDAFMKVQALPEMRLFVNGKEVKKKANS